VIKLLKTNEVFRSIRFLELMESKVKDTKVEGSMKIMRLRTRGLDLEVLLKQGLKDETLEERGSLWCRGTRPQCSLLLP
jgi:hypothetical protein